MVREFDSREFWDYIPRTVPTGLVSQTDAYFEPEHVNNILYGDETFEPEERPLSWEEEFSD